MSKARGGAHTGGGQSEDGDKLKAESMVFQFRCRPAAGHAGPGSAIKGLSAGKPELAAQPCHRYRNQYSTGMPTPTPPISPAPACCSAHRNHCWHSGLHFFLQGAAYDNPSPVPFEISTWARARVVSDFQGSPDLAGPFTVA